MHNSSLPFRLSTIIVAWFFLFATLCIVPQQTFARKAEGRTRTSVHRTKPPTGSRDVRRRDVNVNNVKRRDININKNVNVNVRGDRRPYYDGRHDYYDRGYHHHHHDVGRAFAVGAITGLVIGSIITAASVPSTCSTVNVNGYPYRQCGSTWLQPQYQGSQVTYVVVNPPR